MATALNDVSTFPLRDKAHYATLAAIGASSNDITILKTMAQSHRQQLDLEHFMRLSTMGEMAAELAHELNQPLATILNYAGASLTSVRSDRASKKAIAAALKEIVVETRRAGEIIRRIREFGGKRPPRCESININTLVKDAAHMMGPDLKRDGITVALLLNENLQPAWGDSVQVVQVLVNLLRNARDAMLDPDACGGLLKVKTSSCGNGLRVDIIDQGCGCKYADMNRMFAPYFSTKTQGLGLGLAISQSIMASLGGTLTGRINRKADGMTFSITLPFCTGGQN